MDPGCEWPIIWPDACSELDPIRQDRSAALVSMAVDLLWNWSGRRFGVCPVMASLAHDPLACGCAALSGGSTYYGRRGRAGVGGVWQPALVAGRMVNVACGCWADPCVCPPLPVGVVRLPGPVARVDRVLVDGAPIPESEWSLAPGGLLQRAGGVPWPHEGLTVEYGQGVPVPVGGQIAAGVLAWELGKAVGDCDGDCALPQRLQAITRQGVSVAVMDQFEDLDDGRTGIWLIDSWVASVTRPKTGGTVVSPDLACFAPRGRGWKRL